MRTTLLLFRLLFTTALIVQTHDEIDSIDFVFVKGDTFTMGCTDEQKDCDDESPAHQVTLSVYSTSCRGQVTPKFWNDIMGINPSFFKDSDQCPVEQVSWNDVQEFLKRLKAKYPGKNYRS